MSKPPKARNTSKFLESRSLQTIVKNYHSLCGIFVGSVQSPTPQRRASGWLKWILIPNGFELSPDIACTLPFRRILPRRPISVGEDPNEDRDEDRMKTTPEFLTCWAVE